MITIGRNIASLLAQRQLSQASDGVSTALTRLASGQRINKSSDDAAGAAIAASLNTDARVYSQGVRNINDGVSYLQIADGALQALTSIVTRGKELAAEAANGVYSNKQREALNSEAKALTDEYNRIVHSTPFLNQQVFDAANPSITVQLGYGSSASLSVSTSDSAPLVGDGTFSARTISATGVSASGAYAVGVDLNHDGKADVFTHGAFPDQVFLNNGDGTFTQGSTPWFNKALVTAGDFNSDGQQDVLGFNSTTVQAFLGNGNGSLSVGTTVATGTDIFGVAAADFNNDGRLDVTYVDRTLNQAYVALQNADGTYSQSTAVATGSAPFSISTGDFNNDGNTDAIVANQGSNNLSILLGNGSGGFSQSLLVPSQVTSSLKTVVGDINGDGNQDFVVGGSVSEVFIGKGDGTFSATQGFNNGTLITALRDLNGDGRADLVSASSSSVQVSFGLTDGTLTSPTNYLIGTNVNNSAIVLGDFTGDGVTDILTVDSGDNSIGILKGGAQVGIQEVNLNTASGARDAIDYFSSVLDSLGQQRGKIGASLSRLETQATLLRSSSDNLREAASRITDADIAEEVANLTKRKIQQQTATAVLAQANIQPTIALHLLGAI